MSTTKQGGTVVTAMMLIIGHLPAKALAIAMFLKKREGWRVTIVETVKVHGSDGGRGVVDNILPVRAQVMITSRDFHKITTDGGRIGSLASETDGSGARGSQAIPGVAETEPQVYGNVDVAVVGEVDLSQLPGANRRPLPLPEAEETL